MQLIVYALKDPSNQIIRYIGKSSSGLKRPKQHWQPTYLKRDTNIVKKRWISKLLKNNLIPIIEILITANTLEELNAYEVYYINKYKETLYNILKGGNDTPNTSKSVYRLDIITGEQKLYPSVVSTYVDNFHVGHVSSCSISKHNKYHRGFFWFHKFDSEADYKIGKMKPIVAIDICSKELFFSFVTNLDGFCSSKIVMACKNKKPYKGYLFRYATKEEVLEYLFISKKIPKAKNIRHSPKTFIKKSTKEIVGKNIVDNSIVIIKNCKDAKNKGFHYPSIYRALKNIDNRKQYRNYIWKYKKDVI